VSYENAVGELPGSDRRDEIIVIGAHYDTAEDSELQGTAGANDNASGVAGLVALAHTCAGTRPSRIIRCIAFVNEEPASFKTENMGSLVYARRARDQGDQIVAMINLETIGYYSDEPGSQKYPLVLDRIYPDTGNFIGFVGNISSRELVHESIAWFRSAATIPSEGLAAPEYIPGIGWSDHWSFWQMGYTGIMVTDAAPFRYPHYHSPKDTPDKLDFDRMGRVVKGLEAMVRGLSGIKES
jgi:Zn-dependent M28 family amino/carboxypeptidase